MPARGDSTGLGLLVGEFRGDLAPEYMGKIAGQATRIERLRVDGERAIWIEGAPHFFFYRPPDSDVRRERAAHRAERAAAGARQPAGPPGGRVRPRARASSWRARSRSRGLVAASVLSRRLSGIPYQSDGEQQGDRAAAIATVVER